jgi:hypothetical protein
MRFALETSEDGQIWIPYREDGRILLFMTRSGVRNQRRLVQRRYPTREVRTMAVSETKAAMVAARNSRMTLSHIGHKIVAV